MKYLKIANKGELLVEALTLVGASTKRNDNTQIGMFGSGNKYAISYLLRNNIIPVVYSGTNKIDVGTRKINMRGDDFDIITINGNDTSITTSMGHHWKLWMAIREIYANAIDEGLVSFDSVDEIYPVENESHFYIPLVDDVADFMFNIDDYFSKGKKVLYEGDNGKILKKHSHKSRIYRRGILVYESSMTSSFDYDLYDIPINEDRWVNYEWYIWEEMYKLLHQCNNESIIRQVLSNQSKTLEGSISSVSTISFDYLNDAWDRVVSDKYACPIDMSGYVKDEDRGKTFFLNSKLYNAISGATKKNVNPSSMCRSDNGKFLEPCNEITSERLYERLVTVIDFFSDANMPIEHKITFARFYDNNVYGMAKNEEIILSDKIFDSGNHFVANTIIEEIIHIKSGASDETRAFQDASINMLIEYMKKINGINI